MKALSKTFWNLKPRYWLLRAWLEGTTGKTPLSALRRATAIAERQHMRLEVACAAALKIKFGLGSDDDFQHASTVFRELGCEYRHRVLLTDREKTAA